jgi:transcriptional regulator with XRE-family HTH domain
MAKKARGLTKSLHLPEHRALCDLLVATRRKAGLTQQAVAKQLKQPQSFVAKYEGGERRLDMIEFIAVAGALKSDPIRLLRAFLKRLSVDYPQ